MKEEEGGRRPFNINMTTTYLKAKHYGVGEYQKTIKSCGRFQVCTVFDRDGGVVPGDFPSNNVRFIVANSGIKVEGETLIAPSIKVFDINGNLLSDISPPESNIDARISIDYQQPYPVLQTAFVPVPGFYNFAQHYPSFALITNEEDSKITYSDTVLADLQEVNSYVDQTYPFVSDGGKLDNWEFVSVLGSGDCEDHALEKAKRLLDKGYPASAIHIEIGTLKGLDTWDSSGNLLSGGHAWLCVQLTNRNYYLDNLYSNLRSDSQIRASYNNRARQTGMYWNFTK